MKHHTRILCPGKLSFKSEGNMISSDKEELGEFIANKPALTEMLKCLQREEKEYRSAAQNYILKNK